MPSSWTRAQVRDDLVTRLKAGGIAGQRIFSGRTTPVQDAESLPAVLVYALDQQDQAAGSAWPQPGIYQRRLTVEIECYVSATSDTGLQTAADLSDDIQGLLMTDAAWLGRYSGVPSWQVRVAMDASSEVRRAVAKLTVQVDYFYDWGS